MIEPSVIQPALLSKINERQVLRAIQRSGPMSRAEVARHSGISAPTASKAVESLLRAGLLEEGDIAENGRGRPARRLHLASKTAQVLGLVVDTRACRLVSAGLDGFLDEPAAVEFRTPATYDALLTSAIAAARRMLDGAEIPILGIGISMPGLLDYRHRCGVLSPNLPMTDGHCPGIDLEDALGVPCALVQESHALCLAERQFGAAREIDDFAMLDVSTGIGLGVMSHGRLLTGSAGLAGEVGHITAEIDGRLCGCGNSGCLETVASDSALCHAVSRRLERPVDIDDVLQLMREGNEVAREELNRTGRYLAIGLAAVLNLFNPSTLFVHGRLFEADPDFFAHLVEETRRRALPPSFAECRIVQARGSKRQGAVAAIIEHLTESVVPQSPFGGSLHHWNGNGNGHSKPAEAGFAQSQGRL